MPLTGGFYKGSLINLESRNPQHNAVRPGVSLGKPMRLNKRMFTGQSERKTHRDCPPGGSFLLSAGAKTLPPGAALVQKHLFPYIGKSVI